MLLTEVKVSNNVKLDFFHLEEKSSTNANIFSNSKYIPTLNNYSRFLVTFDDATAVSKGIVNVALGYTFSVYKEIKDTNQLLYVARLGDGGLSVTDYGVANNNTYRYYIFKEDESSISEAVTSNDITTCWWDWSLIDIIPSTTEKGLYYADENNIWKFNLNVTSASTTQTLNNTVYNNLTRYPKVSAGKLNYSTGSLTCILGNIQKTNNSAAEYIEPADMLVQWNNFCANGNIKLLKDRKGNAMLVTIIGTSSQVDDVTREQVNSITFNWTQIGDISDITIIGVSNEV